MLLYGCACIAGVKNKYNTAGNDNVMQKNYAVPYCTVRKEQRGGLYAERLGLWSKKKLIQHPLYPNKIIKREWKTVIMLQSLSSLSLSLSLSVKAYSLEIALKCVWIYGSRKYPIFALLFANTCSKDEFPLL